MNDFASLRRRHEQIAAALQRAGEAPAPDEREELRDAIVSLFRDTERTIEALEEFKESIRPLVERYRALYPGAPAAARPAPRADHLGASTFLERAWNALAGCRDEQALREAERALEYAPGDPQGETLRGWALMRLGRLEEARAALEGVLARDPDAALARANLGYVALRQGRMGEAIENLSRVAHAGDDRKASLYAHLYLGVLYTDREMYRDGQTHLQRALELGPNLIEAYWELGRLHYLEGDRERALAAWRRGAGTNQFNPWGERCGEAAERAASGAPIRFD